MPIRVDTAAFTDRLAENVAAKAAESAVGLEQGADAVQREARRLLALTSHPRGTATPSAPGEPPSWVSGDLSDSVKPGHLRMVGSGGSIQIYPSTVYARIQELGGDTGRNHATHLKARPYMKPALDNSTLVLYSIFVRCWS